MELPENVRIEWQTITELENDELLKPRDQMVYFTCTNTLITIY